MENPNLRTICANRINIRIAEYGDGPLVLLVHGFPESWYSWRHQLSALAEVGYRAVAMDVRGYGGSDAPEPVEAYSMENITADVVGVLDALGEESAVLVGHDWGAIIAWQCALLHPQRFHAVAALGVPFSPRSPVRPTEQYKQAFQDNFFYILYFQEPGVAEAELEADVRNSLRRLLYVASGDAPRGAFVPAKKKGAKLLDGLPEPEGAISWLSDDELEYYVQEFTRTGFRGGLNRYRNMDLDWEQLERLADAEVQQPALFIAGDQDVVLQFIPLEPMREKVPNLTETPLIPGCGHWTQQERPAEVNEALMKFLGSLA